LSSELIFILQELKQSPRPFEKIDELRLNENLKALLRRKILEECFKTPVPFLSSTITDFAENPVYKDLKPIGSMEKPIGYLGSLIVKTSDGDIYSHLILDLNLVTNAKEIREAVRLLEKGLITVTKKQLMDDESVFYLRRIVGNAYKTEVDVVFESDGIPPQSISRLLKPEETILRKLYQWFILFEIYSLLEIPVVAALFNEILGIRVDSRNGKTVLSMAYSTYFTKPGYNHFVEELLRILGVNRFEDIPIIVGVYSLLSLLAFSMKE
jgi:hypothetical protein